MSISRILRDGAEKEFGVHEDRVDISHIAWKYSSLGNRRKIVEKVAKNCTNLIKFHAHLETAAGMKSNGRSKAGSAFTASRRPSCSVGLGADHMHRPGAAALSNLYAPVSVWHCGSRLAVGSVNESVAAAAPILDYAPPTTATLPNEILSPAIFLINGRACVRWRSFVAFSFHKLAFFFARTFTRSLNRLHKTDKLAIRICPLLYALTPFARIFAREIFDLRWKWK